MPRSSQQQLSVLSRCSRLSLNAFWVMCEGSLTVVEFRADRWGPFQDVGRLDIPCQVCDWASASLAGGWLLTAAAGPMAPDEQAAASCQLLLLDHNLLCVWYPSSCICPLCEALDPENTERDSAV